MKDALSPQELFADLGLKYFGPVDGHDVAAMESALRRARHFGGPVIVHAVTRKGNGYPPAENDEAEQMHSPGRVRPGDRPAHRAAVGRLDQRVRRGDGRARGAARPDVVAITAAMLGPTGLAPFAAGVPGPVLRRRHRRAARADLGRRAGHGRAAPGGRGVLDVPQPGLRPAADGRGAAPPGRHARARPGRRHRQRRAVAQRHVGPVAARRRARACGWPRRATPRRCARSWPRPSRSTTGPTALRFPKGAVIDVGAGAAPGRTGSTCCTSRAPTAAGAGGAAGVRRRVRRARVWPRRSGWPSRASAVTVVDPRWVLPVPGRAGRAGRGHRLVVTVADGGRHGGFGSALADALRAAECDVPLRDLALPQEFLDHGSRADVLAAVGLTAQDVARRVTEWAAGAARRGARPRSGVVRRLGPRRNRRADAGAGRRGRAAAGRRGRPRAAPRGHGRRRRLRRRHRAREVDRHPVRRGGAGPRPARACPATSCAPRSSPPGRRPGC